MNGADMPGTLYVVATPIGNLEDITLRALRVLREVELIACEDTRQTRKLLARHEIKTPMISYHEHNEQERSQELIENLKAGSTIALVSDAGAPTISDPGLILIQHAIDEGIPVVPIPGPSAVITALMAAGLLTDRFLFLGFLPARRTARRTALEPLRQSPYTLVFHEAPHRIQATVQDALEILNDRPAVLARELTKIHEEFLRAPLSQLLKHLEGHRAKGEMVLIVAGVSESDLQTQQLIAEHGRDIYDTVIELMRTAKLDLKAAVKQVARARGMSKNEVYRAVLKEKAEREQ
jgi:16S rRNA (cytidine1402-2'-O)-methyltransferase